MGKEKKDRNKKRAQIGLAAHDDSVRLYQSDHVLSFRPVAAGLRHEYASSRRYEVHEVEKIDD
jgi:hypothetical protein